MKTIIAMAALLIASSTFAISESDSWNDIRDEVASNHKLQLSGGAVFIGQIASAFDVCIDGDNFVSKRQYPIYKTKYVGKVRDNDGDNDGWTSVVVGYKTLVYPMTYESTREVCANNGKRCKRVPVTIEQSSIKNFKIKKLVRSGKNGSDQYRTLFTKAYEIETCN